MDLNFTLVVFALSFLVFLGIMKLAFFDRLAAIIKSREKFIDNNLEAAKQAVEKSKQELKDSNALEILAKARFEAQEIITRAIETANNEKQSILQENKTKIQNKINEELELMKKEEKEIASSIDKQVQEIVKFTLDKFYSEIEGRETVAV